MCQLFTMTQRLVMPRCCCCCSAAAAGDDWGRFGKRNIEERKGESCLLQRKDHLYTHMTYKPLTGAEHRVLSKSYDDGRHATRRT